MRILRLPAAVLGEVVPLTVDVLHASGTNRGQAKAVTSATILVLDAGKITVGTAGAGSTTTALHDAERTEAADYWNGLAVEVTVGGSTYTRAIADFSTGVLTLAAALPVADVVGGVYVIRGLPLVPRTAATVVGNQVTYLLPAGVTAEPGLRFVLLICVYADGSRECLTLQFEVLSYPIT